MRIVRRLYRFGGWEDGDRLLRRAGALMRRVAPGSPDARVVPDSKHDRVPPRPFREAGLIVEEEDT